jgi:hypothetical protein
MLYERGTMIFILDFKELKHQKLDVKLNAQTSLTAPPSTRIVTDDLG